MTDSAVPTWSDFRTIFLAYAHLWKDATTSEQASAVADEFARKMDDLCQSLRSGPSQQIDVLATFILSELPDKITENEGAGETAVRIMREFMERDREKV